MCGLGEWWCAQHPERVGRHHRGALGADWSLKEGGIETGQAERKGRGRGEEGGEEHWVRLAVATLTEWVLLAEPLGTYNPLLSRHTSNVVVEGNRVRRNKIAYRVPELIQ